LAWIESHDDVWEHHKTIRLCHALGISRPQAVGHLHAMWHFTLRNAWKDADLSAWGVEEVERIVFWSGEKGAFVKALQEVGFLDGLVVHGWLERAGRLVYDRRRNERRKKRQINGGKSAVKRRISGGKSEATLPNPTIPNHTKPNTTPPQAATARFSKPSAQEVTAYGKEIGFAIDGLQFVDHYEARGWQYKQGQPMKDWRAAVRTWRRNGFIAPVKPAVAVYPSKPYVEDRPKDDEIIAPEEVRMILSGLGKGIPK